MKKIVLVMIILSGVLVCLNGLGGTERNVTIYYTASLNGNLDGCSCKTAPKSGLVKRAAYLRGVNDRNNTLLLDAGDMIGNYPDDYLIGQIFEVYKELKYDAIALGDMDFIYSWKNFLDYPKKYPILVNNLTVTTDEGVDVKISKKPLIFNRGNIRIGIISLIDDKALSYIYETANEFRIQSIEEIASSMISLLESSGAELKILLYHGKYEDAVKFAEKFPIIDIIILGHEQKLIDMEKINNTVLVSPGEEGNRVGILKVVLRDDDKLMSWNRFQYFQTEIDPDDISVRKRILKYYDKYAAGELTEDYR